MALVKLENLGKRKNGKWTLWDVDLEINTGEILGVFGRSESGKSTLGRVISGLEEQTTGGVLFHDPQIGQFVPSMALNDPAFAGELTVYENMEMFAALLEIPRKKRSNEISFLLELMKVSQYRTCRLNTLSDGAIRRLEIARALLADSPLTIIDGLIDYLDKDLLEKLWNHLLILRREEKKSFVILTSSSRIAEMCDRIAIIQNGRIGFVGKADDCRKMAGEDMIVLGEIGDPLVKQNIQEQFALVIREEDGFLSFRVDNAEKTIGDLLGEYGDKLSCVYLKRPTLDDALDSISSIGFASAGEDSKFGE